MADSTVSTSKLRFDAFEVDLQSGELSENGVPIRLQGQPFQVLRVLLERHGEIVTREELKRTLWPADTFVDFDDGLNTAVKKVRDALHDSAERHRYIETIPRRGYRFIGPIEKLQPVQTLVIVEETVEKAVEEKQEPLPRKLSKGLWWAVGFATTALFVLLIVSFGRRTPTAPALKVLRYRQLTTVRGEKGEDQCGLDSGLATDGSRVFFAERDSALSQVSVTGGEVAKVPTPFSCFAFSDLSPDKTELLGFSPNGAASQQPLWTLSVATGQAYRLESLTGHDGTWSPDGQRLAYANENNLSHSTEVYIKANDGSAPKKLAAFEMGSVNTIRWSPDGRVLRIVAGRPTCLWEVSADGTNLHRIPLFEGETGRVLEQSWTPDGRYSLLTVRRLDTSGSDIWVRREAPSRFGGIAKPVQLTGGPMSFWHPVSSPDGKHIFVIAGQGRGGLARYDMKLHELEPFLSGISAENLDFSRDGKFVTYVTYPSGMVWRSNLDGSDRRQLTSPPLHAAMPRWSPDGKQIAFAAREEGSNWKIYVVSAEGGESEEVVDLQRDELDPTWTPDGTSLIFGGWSSPKISEVNLRSRRVLDIPGSEGLYSPRVSPDGRYLVAMDTPSVHKLLLFDLQSEKWSELFTNDAIRDAGWPQWSGDSQSVYIRGTTPGAQGLSLYRITIADHKIARVAEMQVPEGVVGYFAPWMGVTPDGSPLLLRNSGSQEIYALDVDLP